MNHIEGKFTGCKNLTLCYQCWLPANKPKAILLVNHGLAEHSGRCMNLVNHFIPRGYAVYSFDQRGHGKSVGMRGYTEHYSYFVDDLDTFLSIVRKKNSDVKIFLIGHSAGGTIAIAHAIRHKDKVDGIIISGLMLELGNSVSSVLIFITRILSLLLPKIGIYVIDASTLSQDQAVVNTYVNDPLVYRGKIRARLGIELVKMMQVIPEQIPQIHLPVLIVHGTDDRLCDPRGSEILYDRLSSVDKTLKLYDGFYHEIFNEPGREQVFSDMEAWLLARL